MKLLPVTQVIQSAKTYLIPSYKDFPNSSLHNLPLVIYTPFADLQNDGGKSESIDPNEIEAMISNNGVIPAWRYGM